MPPARWMIQLAALYLAALTALCATGGGSSLLAQEATSKPPVIIKQVAENSELWQLMQDARAAERARDHGRVVAFYTAALKIEPGPNSIARELHAGRGSAYNYLGMPKEAYADYDAALSDGHAVKTDRQTALWYMGRGYASLQLNEYRRAKDDLDIVVAEVPTASNALAWRGAAHQGLGDREKALADYRAALAVNPDNKRAQDGLKMLEQR